MKLNYAPSSKDEAYSHSVVKLEIAEEGQYIFGVS